MYYYYYCPIHIRHFTGCFADLTLFFADFIFRLCFLLFSLVKCPPMQWRNNFYYEYDEIIMFSFR